MLILRQKILKKELLRCCDMLLQLSAKLILHVNLKFLLLLMANINTPTHISILTTASLDNPRGADNKLQIRAFVDEPHYIADTTRKIS